MMPKLRMKKIDLETIYPQAEKDAEGARLKHLCEIQQGQKSNHADGRKLINEFVKPRQEEEIDQNLADQKLRHSFNKSPEQSRFLDQIEKKT